MPQIQSNTSAPLNYDVATWAYYIAVLINKMRSQQSIEAGDMQTLVNLYNGFVGHYHIVHDLVGIDTYGNIRRYSPSGTYNDHATYAYSGYATIPTPSGVIASGQITAGQINAIIAAINSMRSHNHPVTDIVG